MIIKRAIKKIKRILNRKKGREDCIKHAMWAVGWSREYAEKAVDRAYKKYGIPYKQFALIELCRFPENEWQDRYVARVEKRHANLEKKEKKYLEKVCEKTGWDADFAREKMERAKEISGASFENYSSFRFWELTEEQQKTYYTKGDVITLRRKYNTDSTIKNILRSKELTYQYLGEKIGRKWITTDDLTKERFSEVFGEKGRVMYKPTASMGGSGIKTYRFDPDNIDEVIEKLQDKKRGIIEEFLEQHPVLAEYSLKSVNTIRIVTVTTKDQDKGVEPDKVHFLFAGLRMGVGEHRVDNMHKGGLVAAVDIETGEITSNGINYENEIFKKHPDTGAIIKGLKIPYFKEAKDLIEDISKDMPGFFGWDIAITKKGPVVIEINTSPGAGALQSPYVPEKIGMKHIVEPYL